MEYKKSENEGREAFDQASKMGVVINADSISREAEGISLDLGTKEMETIEKHAAQVNTNEAKDSLENMLTQVLFEKSKLERELEVDYKLLIQRLENVQQDIEIKNVLEERLNLGLKNTAEYNLLAQRCIKIEKKLKDTLDTLEKTKKTIDLLLPMYEENTGQR